MRFLTAIVHVTILVYALASHVVDWHPLLVSIGATWTYATAIALVVGVAFSILQVVEISSCVFCCFLGYHIAGILAGSPSCACGFGLDHASMLLVCLIPILLACLTVARERRSRAGKEICHA